MQQSAGLLLYRRCNQALQVLLVHPGGPFWKHREAGAWSIPKGVFGPEEEGLAAAIRETTEETGHTFSGQFIPLQPVKQKGGKIVYAWALEADFDPAGFTSNHFPMQWPPKSGNWIQVPEVDAVAWCSLDEARIRINPAQWHFIEQLQQLAG